MNALIKPLVTLAVLSTLAFAPGALARPPACEDICACSWVTCEDTCWNWGQGITTCGDSGLGCEGTGGGICRLHPEEGGVDGDTSELRCSSNDSAQMCSESQQEPASSPPAGN
jgi:hypothetical protein